MPGAPLDLIPPALVQPPAHLLQQPEVGDDVQVVHVPFPLELDLVPLAITPLGLLVDIYTGKAAGSCLTPVREDYILFPFHLLTTKVQTLGIYTWLVEHIGSSKESLVEVARPKTN